MEYNDDGHELRRDDVSPKETVEGKIDGKVENL